MIGFRSVPVGAGDSIDRPLLDVHLGPRPGLPQTCLLDTGAGAIRMSADLARAAGVDLPAVPTGPDLIVGGIRSQRFTVDLQLTVLLPAGPTTWRTEVSFCHPWPHPFGLLGLRGFFDRFDVLLQGAERRFSVTLRS